MDYCDECSKNVSWIDQRTTTIEILSARIDQKPPKSGKCWASCETAESFLFIQENLAAKQADMKQMKAACLELISIFQTQRDDRMKISIMKGFPFSPSFGFVSRFQLRRVDSSVDICFEIRSECFSYLAVLLLIPDALLVIDRDLIHEINFCLGWWEFSWNRI